MARAWALTQSQAESLTTQAWASWAVTKDHEATDQLTAATLESGERPQPSSATADLVSDDLLDDLANDIHGAWGV